MPDIQERGISSSDDFRNILLNTGSTYKVSPKMNEYVEMVETFLLIREKKVIEQTNSGSSSFK